MSVHLVSLWLIHLVTPVAAGSALYVTPHINKGHVEEARNLSAVDPSLFLGVKSYSGFITVDEQFGSNSFYWYFPVVGKPVEKTPWILWLQGGPGASSLTGLFDEVGPFEYVASSNRLKLRKYAWTRMYSMVFIDNPVGAGFSFTNSKEGLVRDVNTCTVHLLEAMRQFLLMFNELIKAPLYIAGESYAGVYLPSLGLKIHNQDSKVKSVNVNLQGIIMGNPLMSRIATANYTLAYHRWGLIDSQGAQAVKPLQDAYLTALEKGDAYHAYDLRQKLLEKLKNITQQYQLYNILQYDFGHDMDDFIIFLTQHKVRDAIHVGANEFSFTNASVRHVMASDFLAEGGPKTIKLLNNYNVLIYCGILDVMIPCVEDAHHRRINWRWKHVDNFLNAPRVPWWFRNTRVGYVKSGGHLSEVLILGAGHMVPVDKPAELFHLVVYFIEGLDLPVHPKFVANPDDTPNMHTPNDDDTQIPFFILVIHVLINVFLVIWSCRWVVML